MVKKKYFKWDKYKNSKTQKYHILNKTVPSIINGKCCSRDEKLFEQEESMEILKILGLIKI